MLYCFSYAVCEGEAATRVNTEERRCPESAHVSGLSRLRTEVDEQTRLKLWAPWRAMKACARDPALQLRHGQPAFPAYTAVFKLADVMAYFKLRCNRFCALADGPGTWSLHLLAYYPESVGVGITLADNNKQWSWLEGLRNHGRFTPLEGDLTDPATVGRLGAGFDLVVADGGGQEVNDQETETFKLLAAEALAAVSVLAPSGNFIMKIYDTFCQETRTLLWALSHAFRRINVTHPLTVRPNNAERYLVCTDFRGIGDGVSDTLAPSFVLFLEQVNQRSLELQSACQVALAMGFSSFPENISDAASMKHVKEL